MFFLSTLHTMLNILESARFLILNLNINTHNHVNTDTRTHVFRFEAETRHPIGWKSTLNCK